MPDLSLASFTADLSRALQKFDLKAKGLLQNTALDTWVKVVARNPVDTGRSAAGWDIAVGAPSDHLPPEIPQDVLAARRAVYATGAVPGRIVPEPTLPDVSAVDIHEPTYITNRVEYVPELEDGSSDKAPQGMVRVTVEEIKASLETLIADADMGGMP